MTIAVVSDDSMGTNTPEKQALTRELLHAGADIAEINTVRRHLSRVKGGQLAAAAWPARMLALMISDVPGDDPAVVGDEPLLLAATGTMNYGETFAKAGALSAMTVPGTA